MAAVALSEDTLAEVRRQGYYYDNDGRMWDTICPGCGFGYDWSSNHWPMCPAEDWQGRDKWSRADGLRYLTRAGMDSWLSVPGSRYGRTTEDCAPVAWRLAYLVARESGEGITVERLDHAMSLVVHDSEDVAEMVRQYGHRHYR